MEPGVIPEIVDHHDHPQDTVIETQHGSKEHLQALLGAVAQLRQELSVVFEIDARQNRDAEDELSVRDGIEDVVGDVFPELNRFLGMTARAKPASFTRECQKVLMPALRIGAAHPGKPLVQVSASQVFLNHIIHHRPEEPVMFPAMLVIPGLEVFIVVVQYFPQRRISGLSRVVDRRMVWHKESSGSVVRRLSRRDRQKIR